MGQARLNLDEGNSGRPSPKRSGPPNRMNDLSYTDWMKFQKSFFRHTSWQGLVEDCIHFFTKAVWPDGQASRSLIIGFADFDAGKIKPPRVVDAYSRCETPTDLIQILSQLERSGAKYDFIFVNLRHLVTNEESLAAYLGLADHVTRILRQLLVPQRYCGFVVGTAERGGAGFPLPWSVALSSRRHLRLRDEKIGLMEDTGSVYYCLFLQAEDDARPADSLMPSSICVARVNEHSGLDHSETSS